MTTIAVVLQSDRGHTRVLAEAVVKGIDGVADVESLHHQVLAKDIQDGRYSNGPLLPELDQADGIFFGCATYMGSVSAIFKAFLEAAFRLAEWR